MTTGIKLVLITVLLPLLGNSQQRWYSSFGWPEQYELSLCLQESYDQGYIISGKFSNAEGLVVKTSKNGELLWDKVIVYGNSSVNLYANIVADNGRTILAGHTGVQLMISLDVCGKLEWCHFFRNHEHFKGGNILDGKLLEDGNILLLARMITMDDEVMPALLCMNQQGNLLWYKTYLEPDDYPDLRLPDPWDLNIIDSVIFMSGNCYYRLPDNPDVFALRPMFVKIDEYFKEEWLLPYGHNLPEQHIGLFSQGVMKENDSVYIGFGHYNNWGATNGLLMKFSSDGYETEYFGISNPMLDEDLTDNHIVGFVPMDDTLVMVTSIVSYDHDNIHVGDYIVSTKGNVYGYQYHPNTRSAFHPIIKSSDSKFVISGGIKQDDEWDMYLYKLNADLSSADFVNDDTITYDYLCDDLPIASDTIDLSGCGIITNIEEIPGPDEYFAGINNIAISAHPNPASSRITFKIEKSNTSNIKLQIYNTSGKKMNIKPDKNISGTWEVNIFEWPPGLYIATAIGKDAKNGNVKFIVN